MKTRSLGIAFAALLACAPVRGFAEDATAPAAPTNSSAPTASPSEPPKNAQRPSIVPQTAEPVSAPATEATPRKKRRYARHHYRRYAYWEPFRVYWPNYHRQHLTWRRVAWFNWF